MKYFLFFPIIDGTSEDSNVHYADLVIADTEQEAIEKFVASCLRPPNLEAIGIKEMTPIQ